MTEPMTDERLATLEAAAQIPMPAFGCIDKSEAQELVAEARRARSEETRLRAENERLTKWGQQLQELASDVGACLCPFITPPGYPAELAERDNDGSCPVHSEAAS